MVKESFKFTPTILQTIIQKNLTLFNYYKHLYPILKSKYDKQQSLQKKQANEGRNIVRSSLLSLLPQFSSMSTSRLFLYEQQAYEFKMVEEALDSKQFIEHLHPYINSLLTTTNIGIIKETLKIYSFLDTIYDRTRALHRIKTIVNTLTLYQINNNTTSILCDFDKLNQIFCGVGFIITKKQFDFYHNQLWADLHTENSLGGKENMQYLQIYDLLGLAVELEEVQVLRMKLREWMGSDQFYKYYYKPKIVSTSYQQPNDGVETKSFMEENLNISKLRIQYLGPMELLDQIEFRMYNVDEHFKKFTQLRKGLLQTHDKQQENKKFFDSINAKSTKTINTNTINCESVHSSRTNNTKMGKSLILLQSPKIHVNNTSGDARRDNKNKQQQQIFNSKVLNGDFVREQIYEDISNGKAIFLENGGDADFSEKTSVMSFSRKNGLSSRSKIQDKKGKQNFINIFEKNMKKIESVVETKQEKFHKKIVKRTSIHLSMPKSVTSSMSQIPKQTVKVKSNFYQNLMNRVKNQQFYNLGQKIFI